MSIGKQNLRACSTRPILTTLGVFLVIALTSTEQLYAGNECEEQYSVTSVSGGAYRTYRKRDKETRCEGYISANKSNYRDNRKRFVVRSLLHAEVTFLTRDQLRTEKSLERKLEAANLHLEPYFTKSEDLIDLGDIRIQAEAVESAYRLDATLGSNERLKWSRNVIDRKPVHPHQIWAKGEIVVGPSEFLVPVLFYGDTRPNPSSLAATFEILGNVDNFNIELKCEEDRLIKRWDRNQVTPFKKNGITVFELILDSGDCSIQDLAIEYENSKDEFQILRKIDTLGSQ